MPIYDQGPCYNQNFSDDQPPFYFSYQQQQFDCCEVCEGPHYSSDCQTRNQLVYEPNPGNNYDFSCFDQPPQYHIDQSPPQDLIFDSLMHICRENNRILEEMLRTLETNSPLGEPEGSDDYTEVTNDMEQCLSDHYTAPEDDKIYKSSVDDLVPIPRETEVTSDREQVVDFLMENVDVADLPRHMVKQLFGLLLQNPSLTKGMSDEPLGDDTKPRSFDVTFSNPLFDFNDDYTLCYDNPLFDEEFEDINMPFLLREHLGTLSTGIREIDFNPSRDIEELERLLADDPVPVLRVFDEPLGNSDSMSRSSETSYLFEELIVEFGLDDSIPTKIDDRYHDSEGDILYLEQLLNEDTSSDVSQALLPTESSSLVPPLPDPKQICLREVERFDPFFSLTQSGEETRVMETSSFGFHYMPSPRPATYSPKEVMYCYFHPHLTSGDGFDHGPKTK
ncbi:hypothetical protein Tco_0453583 [Tanacetum coccineum]